MNNCEQKLGIFTLKKCEKRAKHQCEECGKRFCSDHFTEHNLCKSCYSNSLGEHDMYRSNHWYWYVHNRRYTEYEESDLEMVTYTELMSDEVEMVSEEFEQEDFEAEDFNEADVSFYDS
ncbi:hypothetical protein [Flammeovirga sp. SJP92]|uniref:hypothetical protein n=1 Tax=Flammeovirga sp. SJP92 TaxID=1775430 RepID=UPI0007874DBC|nr:hypothetical protein [Flammeovirga sp. SJP92]KXX68906.1 hypothetical protein AVL50_17250 [Flammeovirga sp. SJP92]